MQHEGNVCPLLASRKTRATFSDEVGRVQGGVAADWATFAKITQALPSKVGQVLVLTSGNSTFRCVPQRNSHSCAFDRNFPSNDGCTGDSRIC